MEMLRLMFGFGHFCIRISELHYLHIHSEMRSYGKGMSEFELKLLYIIIDLELVHLTFIKCKLQWFSDLFSLVVNSQCYGIILSVDIVLRYSQFHILYKSERLGLYHLSVGNGYIIIFAELYWLSAFG